MCYRSHSICAEQPIFANNLRLYRGLNLDDRVASADIAFALGKGLLDGPASPCRPGQLVERCARRAKGQVKADVLGLAARAAQQHPALPVPGGWCAPCNAQGEMGWALQRAARVRL